MLILIMGEFKMIGPDKTVVKVAKKNGQIRVTIPKSLIDEAAAKGEMLEDRDEIRLWIEKTGVKASARGRNPFEKKD